MTPVETCARVRDAYERGLYVQACELGRSAWGRLGDWPGTEARILALRIAANCGAPRLADWLTRLAYRHEPGNAEARYYEARRVGRRRGPYEGLRWMRRHGDVDASVDPEIRSSWYSLGGELASALRDFDQAERWLKRADEADPNNPWVKVCWGTALEREDRYDEALARVREALAMRPWYRPAIQALGHLLLVAGQDEEAIVTLRDAAERLECFALHAQLMAIQLELKRYEDARASLDHVQRLAVLAEKPLPQWIAGNRSEIAYFLGDTAASIRYARESDSKFWKAVADRLENPEFDHARAKTLNVGFVRQHHVTCAPATLAAISRYWEMPADHLQVADEICYNGTSAYSERKWAVEHGWVAREFSVTERSAQELLELGVPFTFTTVDPGNSHLQAVIGYDGRRGTLVIRDPYWRTSGEALAPQLLERYQASGPRGMAMVPRSRAADLESIELPDAPLWDRLFALDHALVEHRRDDAGREYADLQSVAPDHRLTWDARRRLAIYDGNATEHLAAIESLVRAFPNDQRLELERLSLLRNQGRRDERLESYARLCAKAETHPIFWQQYANELRADARRWDEAISLLRRAIQRWPSEGVNYATLAFVYWDQRKYEDALELHRIAACLGDKDEQLVMAYFSAADWFKQTGEALGLLRDRFERFGQKSSDPGRSLASAYMQLDRYGEALEVIEEALVRRPDDGELKLYAADLFATASSEFLPRARELVEAALDKAPRAAWLRSAARLAVAEDRMPEALELWREVLRLSPLAIDAHTAVARLLFALEGDVAATRHLAEACERFPNHVPLHELWVEWIREEPAEVREPVIRRLLDACADNAWAHRELGFLLAMQQRDEEAWAEAEVAERLEPTSPSLFLLKARVLRNRNQVVEAKQELRKALEASIDNEMALAAWLDLCETIGERRAVLDFFQEQLQRQVIFGDGLLALRERAGDTLEPEEVLTRLREALAHRPDLWHAWSALILQLIDADKLAEAWQVACDATDRFPLLPRLWIDRADVCRARLDRGGELEALENAYRINPSWSIAVRRLCDALNQRGDYDKALAHLTTAAARAPNDGAIRTLLAETQWRLGQREAALESLRVAVKLDPGQTRGWDLLQRWADEQGCPELPRGTARELTERRPGDARSWMVLARVLDQREEVDERLAALDRAIELNPRNPDAHDQKAETLALVGRFEEASEACRPPIFGDFPPMSLRGRAAWIEAERGDLKSAIEQMRAVLDEEPYYYWGWSRMADWCQSAQDMPGYLNAAQWLVRLSPQYEVSLGYLGEARALNGDREGAREAYERAYELNPRYEFAGTQLFDMALEDGRLDDAEDVLARLSRFAPGPLIDARGVQLSAKRGEKEVALEGLRRVALVSFSSSWPLDAATTACLEAGWTSATLAVLELLVLEEAPIPQAAEKWIEILVRQPVVDAPGIDAPGIDAPGIGVPEIDAPGIDTRLRRLAERAESLTVGGDPLPDDEVERRERIRELPRLGVRAYLNFLIERKDRAALRRFVTDNDSWLRANETLWGLIGWAWTTLRDYSEAARWMHDWRTREDARPWALVNTVEGLRNTGRREEAVDCCQFALTRARSNGLHLHLLWLAADAIERRDSRRTIELLEQMLEAGGGEPLDDDYSFLSLLIDTLLNVETADPAARLTVFEQFAPRLNRARLEYAPYDQEPERRRLYRLALRRLARLRGGIGGWLWYIHWLIRSYWKKPKSQ